MSIQNQRTWGTATTKKGPVEVRNITSTNLDECLDVLDDSFFLNECVCNGSQINLPENSRARLELRELCRITAEDGVSLAAYELDTGKPVAVSFNKIQFVVANEDPFFIKFRKQQAHSPQAQCLMDFMISVDSEIDVFERYNLDCVCELMFLATLPEWEGNGLGRILTGYTIDFTTELSQGVGIEAIHPDLKERRPRAVTAIWTSQFSQKVGKASGFEVLNTVPYTKFSYNGKTFAERIDPRHTDCQQAIRFV